LRRRIGIAAAVAVGILLLALWTARRDYSGWFRYDDSIPLRPRVERTLETETVRRYDVRLASCEGADIVAYLDLPQSPPPYPVVIVQGGYRKGREVVDLVGDSALKRGWAVFSMEYRYTGSENPVLLYFQARGAMRDAVLDLRRALDYLESRDDIDASREVIVGVSLGALFAPILASVDGRVDAVALIYGGGNLGEVVRANSPVPRVPTEILVAVSALLYAPFEPLKYAGGIPPRPLLMIHGTGDRWVPAKCAEEFYDRVDGPKEILWHDAGHIRSFKTEEIARLVEECLDWMGRVIPPRDRGEGPAS